MSERQTLSPNAAGDSNFSDEAVLTEQVRMVYNLLGQSSAMTLLLSVFVAFVLREHGTIIAIWLAVQVLLKITDHIEVRWFYDSAAVSGDPRRFMRRLCVTQSAHAAGWACLQWIAVYYANPFQMVFVTMALGGVLSGGVTNYGALPRVHLAYIATFIAINLGAFVDMVVRAPDNPSYYSLPLLQMIYCVATYMNTRVSAETFHHFITLGFANAELARDLRSEVTRTEAARTEAELARQEAEDANAAKSKFLASASHDLRQPIHAAGLFLALLGNTRLNKEQRTFQTNAEKVLKASSSMLDALLDFSRAEAGVIVPQSRIFAIDDLISEIEDELGVQADEKRIVFRVRESGALVESDPALVRLILLNLVSNAVRYTLRGGLLVSSRHRDGQFFVEVWDTGIGIVPEQQEAIFGDFAQLGNPERDRRKGLGLGLAIARKMARLIGSEVTLVSQPGRGSVFRFPLPLAKNAGGMVEPPAFSKDFNAPGATPNESTDCRHIILLDDDIAILEGLGALLRGGGYSVSTAETIEEAIRHSDQHRPDLLICDFRLRFGRDGTEAVRVLRERNARPVPALMITGDTHPDRIAHAEREDLTILYKPVDPARIMETISTILRDEL